MQKCNDDNNNNINNNNININNKNSAESSGKQLNWNGKAHFPNILILSISR